MTKATPFRKIIDLLTHEYMLYAISASIFIGVYYARAAVSIATGALAVIAALSLFDAAARRVFVRDRASLALTAVFAVFVLSGLNSANKAQWFQVLMINIPYLIIPLAIFSFGPVNRVKIFRLLMLFIYVTAFSAGLMIIDYALNFQEYTELYGVGKTIPTPIRHIRYSLFLALAGVLSTALLADGALMSRKQRLYALAPGAVIVVAVHLLAVRTGMIALYAGWLGLILVYVLRGKNWRVAVAALAVLITIGFVTVNSVPSLKKKLAYMRYDLEQLKDGTFDAAYSDNVRLISIKHGLQVWRDNPVFGTGIGDIDDVIMATYERETPEMPEENRFTPISQYVYWLSSLGLLGTLLLLSLLWTPLVMNIRDSYAMAGIYFAIFASIIGETSIQLQLGKTLFLFLVCLLLNFRRWQMLRQTVLTTDTP